MVREVVVDGDAGDLAAQLHAPCDAFELTERLDCQRQRHARVARGGERRERIVDVVGADERPAHLALRASRTRALRSTNHRSLAPPGRLVHTASPLATPGEPLARRPAAHGERLTQARIGGVPDDAARAGHDAHQMMKLALDRRDVVVDVGVVELEVIENECARPVVDELCALVEKRRIVLVRFDDKERRRPRRALVAKFAGTPPIRNPGARPAYSRIQASSDEVVVLPCVPATANTHRPCNTSRASHCGPEVSAMSLSSSASITGMPRVMTLPTSTTSGRGLSCDAS